MQTQNELTFARYDDDNDHDYDHNTDNDRGDDHPVKGKEKYRELLINDTWNQFMFVQKKHSVPIWGLYNVASLFTDRFISQRHECFWRYNASMIMKILTK